MVSIKKDIIETWYFEDEESWKKNDENKVVEYSKVLNCTLVAFWGKQTKWSKIKSKTTTNNK